MVRLRKLENLLLIFGLLMLGIYVAARIHQSVLSHVELSRFKAPQFALPDRNEARLPIVAQPDFSLWSQKRIKDYEGSFAAPFVPAIAVLRIPKIKLEVPVLEGTDDLTLNRGVGRIIGTSNLGDGGNVGIAGHRDGFFRGLKDVETGDKIEMVTPAQIETYVVDRIVIVEPSDVSVLGARSRSLTLVTCYPFYFVGSAPQRYIVQATVLGSESPR